MAINARWRYPVEKFSTARRNLMLPHPNGEASSLASAFAKCEFGLNRIPLDDLDPHARRCVETIEQCMDTTGVGDPGGERGTWYVKAQQLSTEEKQKFANAVDELASWFDRHFDGDED